MSNLYALQLDINAAINAYEGEVNREKQSHQRNLLILEEQFRLELEGIHSRYDTALKRVEDKEDK